MASRIDEESSYMLHIQLQVAKTAGAEQGLQDARITHDFPSCSDTLAVRNLAPSPAMSPAASASPSVDATKAATSGEKFAPAAQSPIPRVHGVVGQTGPMLTAPVGTLKQSKMGMRSMSFDKVGRKIFARSSTGGLEVKEANAKAPWLALRQNRQMQLSARELAGGIGGGPSVDSDAVDETSACSGSAWGGSECSFGVRELQDVPDTFQVGNVGPQFDPKKTVRSSFSKNQERAERKLADSGGKRELVSLGEFLKDPKRVRTLNRRVVDLLTFEGCEDMRRGTPLTRILKQQARIFTRSSGSSSTYTLSEPVSRIDGFISHNWSVPRHHKFLSLCFHYNLPIAAIVTAIFMMLVGLLTIFNLMPELELPDSDYPEGIVCRIGCAPMFLCVAVFVRDIQHFARYFFGGGPIVFLDKTCIHQEDMVVQKKGIEKLGAYLCNSTEMLVLYTDVYLRRLWTVYEVASYFAVKRELTSMKVIPVVIPEVFFGSVVVLYCASTLQLLLMIIFDFEYGFHIVMPFCAFVGLLAARTWARAKYGVTSLLSDFTIQKCECSSENDRAAVCKNVAALMRETQVVPPFTDDAGATAAFDELARNELPQKLSQAMGRHVLRYWQAVLAAGITRGPSWVDSLAGFQHGMAAREFLCITVSCWTDILFLYPVVVSLFEVSGCWFISWTGCKEYGWLSIVVLLCGSGMAAASHGIVWCADEAVHTDSHLAILIVTSVVLCIINFLMYSGPLCWTAAAKDNLHFLLDQESERQRGSGGGGGGGGGGGCEEEEQEEDEDQEGDDEEVKEDQEKEDHEDNRSMEEKSQQGGVEETGTIAKGFGLSFVHQREPHVAGLVNRNRYHSVRV